jgi:ferrous iron transport protein A
VVASAEIAAVFGRDLQTLGDLSVGESGTIAAVDTQVAGMGLARRLAEIGFLPGEAIRVLARVPGGGPIAVRIGSSTFALRPHEASCIRLESQRVTGG